jgi:hypothetical protein
MSARRAQSRGGPNGSISGTRGWAAVKDLVCTRQIRYLPQSGPKTARVSRGGGGLYITKGPATAAFLAKNEIISLIC